MTPAALADIGACIFDAYGTLLDVHSAMARHAARIGADWQALSLAWRQKQIDYTRLRTMSGRTAPFDQITADGLDAAAERLGVHLTAPQRRELLTAYETLAPHPEVRVALEALAATGMRLGVLSNGTPAMLRTAISAAGLAPLLPIVLSVDAVHAYKTAAAAYQLGPEAFALPVGDIGFVSSNAWDAVGATWFGYRVFWVNRVREPMERLGVSPEATGRSLADVGSWVTSARA